MFSWRAHQTFLPRSWWPQYAQPSALLTPKLALRHRQNKRQEQRIVLFVGSPVKVNEADLKRLGGQLKKNKIALDVVNFGEGAAEENRPKLEAFVAAVNNHDNSHIVTLPPGEHMLSQMLNATPIVRGEAAGAAAEGGLPAGGAALDDFGIDPNVDPELALVRHLSPPRPSPPRPCASPWSPLSLSVVPAKVPQPPLPTPLPPRPPPLPLLWMPWTSTMMTLSSGPPLPFLSRLPRLTRQMHPLYPLDSLALLIPARPR